MASRKPSANKKKSREALDDSDSDDDFLASRKPSANKNKSKSAKAAWSSDLSDQDVTTKKSRGSKRITAYEHDLVDDDDEAAALAFALNQSEKSFQKERKRLKKKKKKKKSLSICLPIRPRRRLG